jgi:dCMP deaminase
MEEVKIKIGKKHRHFVAILQELASQSKCLKRQVGALIVKNDLIISTGYNGPVRGSKHCKELGCTKVSGNSETCRAVHAEQNAIINAITTKADLHTAICYCTYEPCATCIKLLKAAGISHVLYVISREREDGRRIADEINLKLYKLVE